MIRVVEAITDTNIGGAGILLANRLEYFDRSSFEISVALPKGSRLCGRLRAKNVRAYEIDGCYDKSFDLKSLSSYIKLFKEIKPDIVNSHGCLNARIAARLSGVKASVFTRHCDFPVEKKYAMPFVRLAIRIINYLLSDGIIAVSKSAKENLIKMGVDKKKIRIIVNGALPVEKYTDAEKNKIKQALNIPFEVDKACVVGIFARLEAYKDHKTLLRAATCLPPERFRILIVGTGSLEKQLTALAKELKLDDIVIFTGFADDIAPLMNITDINVNCSVGTETSSLALSEGMSLGIPSVVSDYPGNLYMVKNRENGLIFRQGDYLSLAKKLNLLASSDVLYSKLSQQSRIRFEKELNARNMTEKTEAYYKELLKRKALNL